MIIIFYGLTKNVDKPRVKMNLAKKIKPPIDEVTSFLGFITTVVKNSKNQIWYSFTTVLKQLKGRHPKGH
jgi:hypothetical protein